MKTTRTCRSMAFASALLVLTISTLGYSQKLAGSGSTFINPIMAKWIAAYKAEKGVTLTYQAIGSGPGIENLISKSADFAASEAPLTSDQQTRANGDILYVPAVAGAVCVIYNVNTVTTGLRLTGQIVADIYLGKIQYWDDPQIANPNPGMNLPHTQIITVHSSVNAGTSAIFTNYLSKVSPEWKSKIGEGMTVVWPEGGLNGRGSDGISAVVAAQPNSIGYVEMAYAIQKKVAYAAMADPKGNYVFPTIASTEAALQSVPLPDDLSMMITNAPQGYPIAGITLLIVRKVGAKVSQLKDFLKWAVTRGQDFCKNLYYGDMPENIRTKELSLINAWQ